MDKCTYLGLQEDPATALEYASDGNFCYHALPVARPNPAHQKAFCLSSEHISCPVFLCTEKEPLPEDVLFHGYKQNIRERLGNRGILLAILLVLLTATLGGTLGLKGILSSSATVPERNSRVTFTQLPLVVVTGSSIPHTSPGSAVEPTSTLNLTLSDCTPPVGWIPYTVIPTDSIFRLSLIFGISLSELQSANCMGDDNILKPGDLIYVPPSLTDTPDLIIQSLTPSVTLQFEPTSPPRFIPSSTFTPTKESKPDPPTPIPPTPIPPTPIPPTRTQAPSDTPTQVIPPTSTPRPLTQRPTDTSEPPTPTSPPP